MTTARTSNVSDVSPMFGPNRNLYVTPPDLLSDEMSRPEPQKEGGDSDHYAMAPAAIDTSTAPIPGGGELLEASASQAFKQIDEAARRQERDAKNRAEEAKHWRRIRRGVPFSYLRKVEDQSIVEAVLAPGVQDRPQPIPNKVDDLCSKQVSQILVDPPLPDPKADTNEERNRGVSEVASRYLRADGGPQGTNDAELWREVLDANRTDASTYVFVWIDPTAGGWRPMQRYAHPMAEDPKQPLMGPVLGPDGKAAVGIDGKPILERTSSPILRYVGEGEGGRKVFVEHAIQASREWLPKRRRVALSPAHARMHPPNATARNAYAITLLMVEPLSEARRRFKVLSTLEDRDLRALADWRPERWEELVPDSMMATARGTTSKKKLTDDTLIFWYHHFCRIGEDYPDGAEIAVNGGAIKSDDENGTGEAGFVLKRDTLRDDVELDDGTKVPVLKNIPVAQFRAMLDTERKSGTGKAPVSAFGGSNQIRAHLYLSTLQDIDFRLHLNTYITSTSSLTRKDINRRDGTPLEVVSKDDMPTFEQRPQMPASLERMLERIEHSMEVEANLGDAAQVLDTSNSRSGESKKVELAQARVQLAQDWQGFINGCQDYWLISLQQAQSGINVPTLVQLEGEGDTFHAKHFIGADLVGITSVPLLPNTGTMMSPVEKVKFVGVAQDRGWVDPEEAAEVGRASMSDSLSIAPSPHERRIAREIADWCEGPPDGWMEAFAANQQIPQKMQQYQAQVQEFMVMAVRALTSRGAAPDEAQQTAQSLAMQKFGPPPQPTPLADPFEARPNDIEPGVARVRLAKLSRFVSGSDYKAQPPEWRSLVDKAYQSAAQNAGMQTAATQQDQQLMQAMQKLIGDTQQAVINKWKTLAANEVSAMEQATSVAQKPTATPVPQEAVAPHPAAVAASAAEAEAQRGHEAQQNEADRQHEAAMAAQDHGNKLREMAAKAALTPRPTAIAGSGT